jgi:hypothetical protein
MGDWNNKYSTLPNTNGPMGLVHFAYTKDQVIANSNKPSSRDTAENVWVNVRQPGLKQGDKVRIALTERDTYKANGNCGYSCGSYRQNTQFVDLEYAEPGRFTARIPDLHIGGADYTGRSEVIHQVGIVSNDTWWKTADGKDAEFKLNE